MPATATLYLNGKAVGMVTRKGRSTCWGYGAFLPGPGFAEFAPLFRNWASLMHAGGADREIPPRALERLRELERSLDTLDSRLRWHASGRWTRALQINIDGTMIEWKDGSEAVAV